MNRNRGGGGGARRNNNKNQQQQQTPPSQPPPPSQQGYQPPPQQHPSSDQQQPQYNLYNNQGGQSGCRYPQPFYPPHNNPEMQTDMPSPYLPHHHPPQSIPHHQHQPGQQPFPSNNTTMSHRSHLPICSGCQKPIAERFLLKAMEALWHEDCLKCSCCDCRLGEVGSTLFSKNNMLFCKRDYLRIFGKTGLCSACNKTIPAYEMVMKVRDNKYHLECFACHKCNHRFCVGDKFYLLDNRVLCENDCESNNSNNNQRNLSTPITNNNYTRGPMSASSMVPMPSSLPTTANLAMSSSSTSLDVKRER